MKRVVGTIASATFVLALVCTGLVLCTPQPAKAAGATVVDTPGGASLEGGDYEGVCHNVKTPSGNVNVTCHLRLTLGTPVDHATHVSYIGSNYFGGTIPCQAVLTPSGEANVSCHD